MLRYSTYLLSCLLALTGVMGGSLFSSNRLDPVDGRKLQCKARGSYEGACITQNMMPNGFGCNDLVCAQLLSGGGYEAVSTGPVLDGTECAADRVCKAGQCVVPESKRVPPRRGDGPQYTCRPKASVIVSPPNNSPNQQRNSVIVGPPAEKKRRLQ